MSCYGYVTTDAVNFREQPYASAKRIRLMKKYALFIVYGSVQSDGETWYKVSWNNQMGYVNGKYFKQMTVGEAEEFLASSRYQEGIANNADQSTGTGSSPVTTGSPTGVVTAEDQKVSEWVNPATGSTVSYEPFDPFATPAPLAENELEKNDFINGLISKVQSGEMKAEDLETELQKYYKDAKDPEESVSTALAFIQGKLGLEAAEEPTQTPEALETAEPENPKEETSGGFPTGLVIVLVLLLAGAGGGYFWYMKKQQQREAAQRVAKQKVDRQNRAMAGKENAAKPSGPVSAQNAAKVRTGSYTGGQGTAKPKATPSRPSAGQGAKPYGTGSKNPYGRYSASEAEEDASYTASFKPGAGKDEAAPKDKDPGDGDTEA